MNPHFNREPQLNLPTQTGSQGNGGKPNRPTIVNQKPGTPAPNLFPSFDSTPYNNSAQSSMFPLFNTYVQNTINPIGRTDYAPHMGSVGLAGNGSNQNGAGYKPLNKSPYNVGSLGAISGVSQEFPYLTSQLYADGMVNFHHPVYYGINKGEEETYSQGTDLPRGMPSSQSSIMNLRTPDQERAMLTRAMNTVDTTRDVASRMASGRRNATMLYNERDRNDRRRLSAPYQMVYN